MLQEQEDGAVVLGIGEVDLEEDLSVRRGGGLLKKEAAIGAGGPIAVDARRACEVDALHDLARVIDKGHDPRAGVEELDQRVIDQRGHALELVERGLVVELEREEREVGSSAGGGGGSSSSSSSTSSTMRMRGGGGRKVMGGGGGGGIVLNDDGRSSQSRAGDGGGGGVDGDGGGGGGGKGVIVGEQGGRECGRIESG